MNACELGRVSTIFFFFSSRRRHTRYWRDWSSDVCSSDLLRDVDFDGKVWRRVFVQVELLARARRCGSTDVIALRSEERRVGEEGRSRWSPDHLKKKELNVLQSAAFA